MPKVHFALKDGSTRSYDAKTGDTVMNLAVTHAVPGIEAICGGGCSCATCHVYVDAAWIDRLPAPSEDEADMLDSTAADRRPTSRLSCQIRLTDALDGLIVSMPEYQS
jgi:2Fe-2S ferredoxin